MGDVISEAKLLDPRNRAKVEQSLSLIFRGKAGIAGSDPALRPFVNALLLKGAVSARQIFNRIQAQKQEEIRATTLKRVQEAQALRGEQKQQIIIETRRIESRGNIFGVGRFTRAVDIGRGKMQDVLFTFSKGKIIQTKPIGKPIPQTESFRQRKSFLLSQEKRKQLLKLRVAVTEKKKIKTGLKIVPFSFIPIPSIKKAKVGIFRVVDFVSGGALTERNLNKRGKNINFEIERFNQKYSGKELSETEFITANGVSASIENKERILSNDRDNLARTLKSRIAGFLSPFEKRRTALQQEKHIRQNQPTIRRKEKTLNKINSALQKSKKGTGVLSKINTRRLRMAKKGFEDEIDRLRMGDKARIFAGEFPIIPAISIPSGVTKITFLGTQKRVKSGKIITDIAFKTSGGRVGVAKGVSVVKGKETASVILGRSGKVVFKFPSAKKKIISVRSFIGREKTITRPVQLAIRTKIQLLVKAKKAGIITKIKKNIEALQQVGVGQVASIRGRKFIRPVLRFPSGKIKLLKVKPVFFDDFASVSAIFTKKELSLIIGKTITRMGAKSRFLGIIKGTTGVGKTFSIADKQQFSQALGKVVSAVAVGVSKTKGVSGLTRSTSLVEASILAVKFARSQPTAAITKVGLVKVKVEPKPKLIPLSPKPRPPIVRIKINGRTITRTVVAKTKVTTKPMPKTKQEQKQQQKVIQRQREKLQLLQRQKQNLIQRLSQSLALKQIQIQQQRLIQVQRQINKLLVAGGFPITLTLAGVLRMLRFLKLKRKRRAKAKGKVTNGVAYNVFARPLKKRRASKRPALVKVNKSLLKKRHAKSLRNYVVDTSLSRTGRIKKVGGKPKKPKLKFPRNYVKKSVHKFRNYRIVKGKRIRLPKGKVIEKRRFLLDTRQEKRGILLRRRIKQLAKRQKRRKKK